jgi:hypothetical protein
MNAIYQITRNNSYTISIITKLNNKLETKKQNMITDITTIIYLVEL